MKIVEKNEGTKIAYTTSDKRITFNDDLTINLAKRQRDWPVHIDVCSDEDNELVIGTAAGRSYIAEIDIPAKEYEEIEDVNENDSAEAMSESTVPQPLPFDMESVTLTLWAIKKAKEI